MVKLLERVSVLQLYNEIQNAKAWNERQNSSATHV